MSGLAIKLSMASRSKFALLVLLVAVGMSVFLVVSELSRASTEDLDEAITADVGETGTYVAELASDMGMTPEELGRRVDAAVGHYATKRLVMAKVLPETDLDCPGEDLVGSRRILILSQSGTSVHLAGQPVGPSRICLGGVEVPPGAVVTPTELEESQWGDGVFVDAAYEHLAALSSIGPISYRFAIVTHRPDDMRDQIEAALLARMGGLANRYGADVTQLVSVQRSDSGENIKAASQGVKVVYGVVGWGILILGGLGLLVSELIVVRDRSWFFGLSRAVGSGSSHIAWLILTDIVLVLLAGTALAMTFALAIQPTASSFAETTFQLKQVRLLRASTIPLLITGEFLVLAIAGVYPAWRAVRQDPLDVLEPSAS